MSSSGKKKSKPRPPGGGSGPKPPPSGEGTVVEGKDGADNNSTNPFSSESGGQKKSSSSSSKKGRSKEKKTKPFRPPSDEDMQSPGLFMMGGDSDEDIGAGGSFLDMGARSQRSRLGVPKAKKNPKKKKKKKDKATPRTPSSKPPKDSKKDGGETRDAETFSEGKTMDNALGDSSDDANNFDLNVSLKKVDLHHSSRGKSPTAMAAASAPSGAMNSPHERVFRSASSDEDESHNVVPIDMHDLMSSIRKAPPPGTMGDDDEDDEDDQRRVPLSNKKTPRRLARDFFGDDDEEEDAGEEGEVKQDKVKSRKKSKKKKEKLFLGDHITRVLKHFDDMKAILESDKDHAVDDGVLGLFADSCEKMSTDIGSFLDNGTTKRSRASSRERSSPKSAKADGARAPSPLEELGMETDFPRKMSPYESPPESPSPSDDAIRMPRKLRNFFSSSSFNFKDFLLNPVPEELGMCYFRVIGDHKQSELFVILDYDEKSVTDLVMTAKRDKSMIRSKKSKFTIRAENQVVGRFEQTQTGKILQFNIYDHAATGTDSVFSTPSKKNADPFAAQRKQIGAIQITNTKDCPRHMTVILPEMVEVEGPDEVEEPFLWKPLHSKEEILMQWKEGNFEHMSFYENKKPHFDESIGAYTLDFDGRVTMASSKNYLLVSSHALEEIYCRFGRVENREFTMDVRYPLSPVQALGISLSSIVTKTTG